MDKEILKSVLADYRVEVSNFKVLSRALSFQSFENYVIIGVRRAGKSFLIYQHIQELLAQGTSADEILYVNFEDERLTGLTYLHLNLLIETHLELFGKKPILFLDEIQNIEGWEKFARRLADAKYRVYITGSNAKMLSTDIQTTLGGRFATIEVYTYSFREFLVANNCDFSENAMTSTVGKAKVLALFSDYFAFGGFPEIAMHLQKRDYLNSLFQGIYLGDIALRNGITNTFALRILFKKLAESVKQPVSFNRLRNIVAATGIKVGTSTIINYIEYAIDAWLILPVQNIADKLVDKETKPKYYFVDNGLLNIFLTDANTSLLENLVAITLLRKYGRNEAVFFYNRNVEVDFYILQTTQAIQVCYTLTNHPDTQKREVDALIKLSKVLTCSELLIITRDTETTIISENQNIVVVPVWKWLLRMV